jgi:molecular chaperone GrpE (heat shock protein)
MQASDIASFKALGRAAQVSDWQIDLLRRGQADRMRLAALSKLSRALSIPLARLLEDFSELHSLEAATSKSIPDTESDRDALSADILRMQQEYDRLQLQMEQQREILRHEFQQSCLRSLESWLIQFPTLVYAAQQNPQFPAKNFLPFIRPLEQLLQGWGVEAIAPVGAEIPYDPQIHQLLESQAEPGDLVKVRYTGYRQGEKLLYRAKVSPVIADNLNEGR